jgi:hypothetical protein
MIDPNTPILPLQTNFLITPQVMISSPYFKQVYLPAEQFILNFHEKVILCISLQRPIDILFHIVILLKKGYDVNLELSQFVELHGSAESCAMLLQIAVDTSDFSYYVLN